jgi:hypothetical protein
MISPVREDQGDNDDHNQRTDYPPRQTRNLVHTSLSSVVMSCNAAAVS